MPILLPVLVALCALTLLPARALASGFAAPIVGPTRAGVSTVDPVGVHLNPGSLGFIDGAQILGGGHLVLGSLRYQRERRATYQHADSLDFVLPIDPLAVDTQKRGQDVSVSDNPVGLIPAAFAAVPIARVPGLTAGFGVYVPYAAQVSLPKTGPQRFQLVQATLGAVFVSAALALRVHKRVSLGLGGSYVNGFANLSKVQDLATLPDIGQALARRPIGQANSFGLDADPAVRELDTMARPFQFKSGTAHGVTGRVGITATPIDRLWLGASYEHTTALNFRGKFSLDMNDPFFTQDLASQGLKYPALVKGKASLSFVLPRVARLGMRYEFGAPRNGKPSSSIALEGMYTGWSSIDHFDVRIKSKDLKQEALGLPSSTGFKLRRDWHDTFGGIVRGRHALSDAFELWAMLGCESGASPDATIDAASPDGTRVSFGGGLSQQMMEGLSLVLDSHVQTVLERRVVSSDYDLANGTYAVRLFSLGAYADYRF